MYDSAKDTPTPHDTASLGTTPSTHSILKLDSATTAEYNEDTNPQGDMAQLQEHFQHLREQLNQLGPTANPPVHVEELAHLTNKLQQLAIMLQLCPPCMTVEEPLHTAMQKHTDTLCTTQWQMSLTTSLLQDIPTSDGQDTMKLKDWLSDIEMAADILKKSCACLAKTKSCGLTNTTVKKC